MFQEIHQFAEIQTGTTKTNTPVSCEKMWLQLTFYTVLILGAVLISFRN